LEYLIWLHRMQILLLGSGGREHALAWKIAASPLVTKLWCAPGNAGIAREAECVALDIADHAAVIDFCRTNAVDFVVVGPETPLAAGIVDDLAGAGIKAFGPGKQASQLEGSKGFTKALCTEFGIPTGVYGRFTNADDALPMCARKERRSWSRPTVLRQARASSSPKVYAKPKTPSP
jgi:phosphoribosylamine---glycine ligase